MITVAMAAKAAICMKPSPGSQLTLSPNQPGGWSPPITLSRTILSGHGAARPIAVSTAVALVHVRPGDGPADGRSQDRAQQDVRGPMAIGDDPQQAGGCGDGQGGRAHHLVGDASVDLEARVLHAKPGSDGECGRRVAAG